MKKYKKFSYKLTKIRVKVKNFLKLSTIYRNSQKKTIFK